MPQNEFCRFTNKIRAKWERMKIKRQIILFIEPYYWFTIIMKNIRPEIFLNGGKTNEETGN